VKEAEGRQGEEVLFYSARSGGEERRSLLAREGGKIREAPAKKKRRAQGFVSVVYQERKRKSRRDNEDSRRLYVKGRGSGQKRVAL